MQYQAILAAALLGGLVVPTLAAAADDGTVVVKSSPGMATAMRSRTVVADVMEVDAAKGHITLKGPQGRVVPLKVSSEVRNLAQVSVGDKVVVNYQESLALTLKKDGKEMRAAASSQSGMRSEPGKLPGGVVAEQVEVTADVIATDAKRQVVTLKGPEQTFDMWVRDPAQFKLVKVGDQVNAVYTQALALKVEPAPKKK